MLHASGMNTVEVVRSGVPAKGATVRPSDARVGKLHLRNRDRLGHSRSPNPPLNSSDLCGVVWRLNVQSGQR